MASKVTQSAATVNAHATALGGMTTTLASLQALVAPTANLTRPAFMTKGARAGDYAPPQMVYIYSQLLKYDEGYRI